MTYESATNVKQRSSNWGRHPPINWQKINSVFNRTMTFRKDSDVVVRHGYDDDDYDDDDDDDDDDDLPQRLRRGCQAWICREEAIAAHRGAAQGGLQSRAKA